MEAYTHNVITDSVANSRHIAVKYHGGDVCDDDHDRNLGLNVEIQCNASVETYSLVTINTTDKCMPKVILQSKAGCPVFTATAYLRYVADHPWIIACLLLVFGAITTFRGKEFFNWVVAILCGGLSFMGSMLIFSLLGMADYLDPMVDDGSLSLTILSFVLSSLIAIVVGYLLYNYADEIGVLALGIIGGIFIGVTLYNTILFWTESFSVLVIVTVLSSAAFAYYAFKLKD